MALPDYLNGSRPYQTKIPFYRKPVKTKPKAKPVPSPSLDKLHERWFFDLDATYYAQLQKEWIDKNLEIKLTKQDDYDQWLNYFKTLPARKLQVLATTGMDILDAEAYSALLRWRDIMANPHRIDKIHQSGLSKPKDSKVKSILELAQDNDRLGVLKATRDMIAEKLEKGAGARDTAALTREMTEVMTQIADYEKRSGANRKGTKLGELLDDMPVGRSKRPGKNGGGSRNTSFKTRVTIEDVER